MIEVVTAADVTALPTALLAGAKQHMRVDTADEDAFIKDVLARAIGRFEEYNAVGLNVAVYKWTPDVSEFVDNQANVPITPVTTMAAALPDATDVTSAYAIFTNSVYGVPILKVKGAYQDGVVFTLGTGFTELPPAVLDLVLRNAAHMFENRELLLPGQEFLAPDMAVDASWWIPRC